MNPSILYTEDSLFLTFVTFLGSFLIWFMFAGLLFLWVIDGRIKKEVVLHAATACLLSWLIVVMLKSLLPTPRPFVNDGFPPLTFTVPPSMSSFPSSHAAVAFAIAVSVWYHKKKIGFWFLILAVLVAGGRVLTNVHFYLDVLVGGVIGILVAYLIKRLHLFKLLG